MGFIYSYFKMGGNAVKSEWFKSLPGCFFYDVLEEDEPGVQSALDLLQEEKDLFII